MNTQHIHKFSSHRAVTAFLFVASMLFTSLTGWAVASPGPLWAGLYGWDTTIWPHNYNLGYFYAERRFRAKPRHDGGFVAMTQRYHHDVGHADFWVSGIDPDGGMEWQNSYGVVYTDPDGIVQDQFAETPRAIEPTDDNGFIMVGSTAAKDGTGDSDDVLLIKLNADGSVAWAKRYGIGDKITQGMSVEQASDGGYVVGATANNYSAMLKVDPSGALEWSRVFAGRYNEIAGVRETAGGYVLGGNLRVGNHIYNRQAWLLKVDYDGNLLWDKTFGNTNFDEYITDIDVAADGGYILVGKRGKWWDHYDYTDELLAVKFGWQGGVPDDSDPSKLIMEWWSYYTTTYDPNLLTPTYSAESVDQADDGGFVVAGTASYDVVGSSNPEAWVLKLASADGAVEWSQYYGVPRGGYISSTAQSVTTTAGGGLLIAGLDPLSNLNTAMMILHTNELGEVEDGMCGVVNEPSPQTTRVSRTYPADTVVRDSSSDTMNSFYEAGVEIATADPGLTSNQQCYYAGTVGIDIEKATNGAQADTPNDVAVPRIAHGDTVTWTYEVTNTGEVPLSESEILVTDSQPGVTPTLVNGSDTGADMILSLGETWTYAASAQALDLSAPPPEIDVVAGCNDSRNTYRNIGQAEVPGTDAIDTDLSHYCNFGNAEIDVRKQQEGPDTRTFPSGSDITFEIQVSNLGTIELDNVMVSDAAAPECDKDIGFMGLGAQDTYNCTVTNVTAAFENTACVTGVSTEGAQLEDCDASTVEIISDTEGPLVSNVITNPNPVSINTPIVLSASVDDSTTGESGIAAASYSINGGASVEMAAQDGLFDSVSEDVVATIPAFTGAGVYDICVAGTDAAGNTGTEECIFLAVYDPSAGFVTGGGWINSPAGAYVADASLTGKANFGFVAKYKKGQSVPDGNTEFQFKAGDLNFKSANYDWLVVAGAKGIFKGSGTINGMGNYGFQLSAIDAALTPSTDNDLFRIKIWDKNNGDAVVYDNNLGADDDADPVTTLGGGQIVIHKKGN